MRYEALGSEPPPLSLEFDAADAPTHSLHKCVGSLVLAAALIGASAFMPTPNGVSVTHARAAAGPFAGHGVLHFPR